jgi:hypothetical protein
LVILPARVLLNFVFFRKMAAFSDFGTDRILAAQAWSGFGGGWARGARQKKSGA